MLSELLRGASSPELNKGLGLGKVSMGTDALDNRSELGKGKDCPHPLPAEGMPSVKVQGTKVKCFSV